MGSLRQILGQLRLDIGQIIEMALRIPLVQRRNLALVQAQYLPEGPPIGKQISPGYLGYIHQAGGKMQRCRQVP